MRSADRLLLVVAMAIFAFFIDQESKTLIERTIMQPPSVIELSSYLNIVLVYNTGISFGIFGGSMADRQLFLIGLNLLIVAGLLVWSTQASSPVERSGLGLVCGGAVGNIFDRWNKGGVTDFIDFHWGDLHWPAFNLADVSISVGFALVLIVSFRTPRASFKEGRLS